MKPHLSQRIAVSIAYLCYLAAVGCALGALLYESSNSQDPIRASLMASVVFFVGCGVVLHVIGKARLKGVLSGGNEPPPPEDPRHRG